MTDPSVPWRRLVDDGVSVRAAAKALRSYHATLHRALDGAPSSDELT